MAILSCNFTCCHLKLIITYYPLQCWWIWIDSLAERPNLTFSFYAFVLGISTGAGTFAIHVVYFIRWKFIIFYNRGANSWTVFKMWRYQENHHGPWQVHANTMWFLFCWVWSFLLQIVSSKKPTFNSKHLRYYLKCDAEDAIRYINGTRLDDRIIRTDWDAGFIEGRQYGRGKTGGQVNFLHQSL